MEPELGQPWLEDALGYSHPPLPNATSAIYIHRVVT